MDQSGDLFRATYEQDVFVPPGTSPHRRRLHATQLCGYRLTPAIRRDMAGTCRLFAPHVSELPSLQLPMVQRAV